MELHKTVIMRKEIDTMNKVEEEIAKLELTREDLTYWEVDKHGYHKHIHLDKSGVKKIYDLLYAEIEKEMLSEKEIDGMCEAKRIATEGECVTTPLSCYTCVAQAQLQKILNRLREDKKEEHGS